MVLLGGGAAAAWLLTPRLHRRATSGSASSAPTPAAMDHWLAVYGAGASSLTLVHDTGGTSPVTRSAACVKLPVDALAFAERDDDLVLLDRPQPALLLVSRDFLRRVAAGTAPCTAGDPSPVRRVPLHSGKIPNRATMAGDRILVTFFKDNLVEEYTWVPAKDADEHGAEDEHEAEATALFVRDIAFRTPEDLGLGDLMVVGNRLLVAARKRLFAIPHRNALWPFVDTRASNGGATGLYRHASSDVWLIASGEGRSAYGSVQRVLDVDPPTLEAEVRLPVNAAPVAGYGLGVDHFAVLQRAGDHLFVFDARDGRLSKIVRFDGDTIIDVPRDIATVPERSDGELTQLVADPDRPGRLYLVDRKRGQLVRVRADGDRITVEAKLAIAAPTWAVSL
jgi:hypothetical protein